MTGNMTYVLCELAYFHQGSLGYWIMQLEALWILKSHDQGCMIAVNRDVSSIDLVDEVPES